MAAVELEELHGDRSIASSLPRHWRGRIYDRDRPLLAWPDGCTARMRVAEERG